MVINVKNILRKVICFYIVLMLACGMTGCMGKQYETYSYKESNEYIKNPYQGPYFQFYTTEPTELERYAEENPECTMVLVAFNLDDEYDMEVIPEEKLEDLRQTLLEAEKLGLSVIVRAAYDFSGKTVDPEFSILLAHIEQIAAVINENKTSVAGVQAGMIGPFGEWNNSIYMEEKTYRIQVIKKWLEELDEDIWLSLRRQKFIRDAHEEGVDIKRLGVYNDGMFASESDLGTYAEDYDREADLRWSKEVLRVPFNGGEMPYVSEFTHVKNVVKEAACLNLSYINRNYHTDVWDLWKSEEIQNENGADYIKKYLGSRLWVESLRISKEHYAQKEIEIDIHVKNTGFAMVNPTYEACVVYTHNGNQIKQNAKIIMISKEEGTISVQLANPYYDEEVEEVTIELQIYKSGNENTDYYIQLANDGVEYKDGKNHLLLYEAPLEE